MAQGASGRGAGHRALGRVLMVACLGSAVLAGCTVNPGDETSSSASSAVSGTATTTTSASPTTPAFGSDVEIPADGVGSARTTQADEWTMTNELDNAYAHILSPVDAPQVAVEAEAVIGDWLSQYRAAGSTTATSSLSTSATTTASETQSASDPSSSVTSTSTSTGTATSTGSPTSTNISPSGSSSPSAADSASTTAGSTQDSFRVLGQLLAARPDVAGLRLYGRIASGGTSRESWRTIWFDPTTSQIVDGTALFATARSGQDPLSAARQLAITAAPAGNLGAVSDRDLFQSAAFTTDGDLVLYIGRTDAEPVQVTLAAADVTPLLSALGQQAKVAAADAVQTPSTLSPTGATSEESASPSESGTQATTATSTSASESPGD